MIVIDDEVRVMDSFTKEEITGMYLLTLKREQEKDVLIYELKQKIERLCRNLENLNRVLRENL